MTDGHEVSLDAEPDEYARRILAEVEKGNGNSQRSLARSAGIALGLTNLVLRKLVKKGLVRITRVRPRRVRYVITPAGVAEKGRMSSAYFAATTRFYAEARDRVRERLAALSASWPDAVNSDAPRKRIAFYGASDVAEIGYICLQETDLVMTAVFDGDGGQRFFGTLVQPVSVLESPASWTQFDVLVVMSFEATTTAQARQDLGSMGFPADRVFWI